MKARIKELLAIYGRMNLDKEDQRIYDAVEELIYPDDNHTTVSVVFGDDLTTWEVRARNDDLLYIGSLSECNRYADKYKKKTSALADGTG